MLSDEYREPGRHSSLFRNDNAATVHLDALQQHAGLQNGQGPSLNAPEVLEVGESSSHPGMGNILEKWSYEATEYGKLA